MILNFWIFIVTFVTDFILQKSINSREKDIKLQLLLFYIQRHNMRQTDHP